MIESTLKDTEELLEHGRRLRKLIEGIEAGYSSYAEQTEIDSLIEYGSLMIDLARRGGKNTYRQACLDMAEIVLNNELVVEASHRPILLRGASKSQRIPNYTYFNRGFQLDHLGLMRNLSDGSEVDIRGQHEAYEARLNDILERSEDVATTRARENTIMGKVFELMIVASFTYKDKKGNIHFGLPSLVHEDRYARFGKDKSKPIAAWDATLHTINPRDEYSPDNNLAARVEAKLSLHRYREGYQERHEDQGINLVVFNSLFRRYTEEDVIRLFGNSEEAKQVRANFRSKIEPLLVWQEILTSPELA